MTEERNALQCPVCTHIGVPAAHVATVAICAACGASMAIDLSGHATRATANDTATLSISELQQLRRARAAIARPSR